MNSYRRYAVLVLLLASLFVWLATNSPAPGLSASSEHDSVSTESAGTHIQLRAQPTSGTDAKSTAAIEGVCGDQNDDGEVNIRDAIIDIQIALGLIEATPEQSFLSDVVRDGEVNIFDAILILQHVVGLAQITESMCEPAGRIDLIVNEGARVEAGGTITLTPDLLAASSPDAAPEGLSIP